MNSDLQRKTRYYNFTVKACKLLHQGKGSDTYLELRQQSNRQKSSSLKFHKCSGKVTLIATSLLVTVHPLYNQPHLLDLTHPSEYSVHVISQLPRDHLTSNTNSESRKTVIMAVTIIDHDGDLKLTLNGGTLKASRKVFCLSSPVFLAMLGEEGHFKESSGQNLDHEGLPNVSFADDDFEAMTFVALIIHLQSDKVPSEIGVEQAYQLARLCDKYDLKKCLGLWPQE